MAKYVTLCKLNYFMSKDAGKIAVVTMDNGEDYKKPNTWGTEAIDSLNAVLDQVEADKDIKGWILTGKQFVFNVGADIMSMNEVTSREMALEIGRKGHAAFKRIMELPFPTLAAINGAALGGGIEVGLYHNYRTVASGPGGCDLYALPECFLGLVPGWGGTQMVTKVAGPKTAIDLIIKNPLSQNRMGKSTDVMKWGLADKIIHPEDFYNDSLQLLIDIITGKEKIERKPVDPKLSDELYAETKAFIVSKVHSGAIAPYRALELIKNAASWTLDEGFEQESQALADMIMANQTRASIYSFDLVQRRAKKLPGRPAGVDSVKVKKIGVIGAGLMASQMTLLFLERYKCPIIVKDIKQEFVDKGLNYIREQLDAKVQKGRLNASDAKWLGQELISGTVTYDGFEDCDFVIEAVFEEMGIKQKVFGELENVCKPECLFLTNTSSLNVTEMGSKLKDPSRCIGFHFFNPIAVMPLIEIIRGEKSSDVAVATCFDMAKKLKKTPVLAQNAPGFIVNRVLTSMTDGVLKVIDEGASFKQADDAVAELGFPMSPFTLCALVGPAITLHVQETLAAAWGDRFTVHPGLKKAVEAGKKAIMTFQADGSIDVDPEVAAVWPKQGDKKFTDDQIREAVMSRVCLEMDCMLKEGVVASVKDIDTAMIMGAGWPFFMGGASMYLDQTGISKKVRGANFHGEDPFAD